eukprot:gene6621-329_t
MEELRRVESTLQSSQQTDATSSRSFLDLRARLSISSNESNSGSDDCHSDDDAEPSSRILNLLQHLQSRRRHFTNDSPRTNVSLISRKPVYDLICNSCEREICRRGMRVLRLADLSTCLYSTDCQPAQRCASVGPVYTTSACSCRIRDVDCRNCGSTLGYNVTEPCNSCLERAHNGHFWLFHEDTVTARYRWHDQHRKPLTWGDLPSSDCQSEKRLAFLAKSRKESQLYMSSR